MSPLGSFFRLHLFFTADDIAGVHTPANFVHCYSKSTHAAFVNIALLDSLLYNLSRNFLYRLLFLNHGFLLSHCEPPLARRTQPGFNPVLFFAL